MSLYLGKNRIPGVECGTQNTNDATAATSEIFEGKTAYIKGGKKAGTMPNNGAISKTIDGMSEVLSASIPAGYTSGGSVSLTDSVELALAAI